MKKTILTNNKLDYLNKKKLEKAQKIQNEIKEDIEYNIYNDWLILL